MTQGVQDPALTTRDIASWMGVTDEYVRGELLDGRMPYENVSRTLAKKAYRVRLSDFIAYLRARGYKRVPALTDFN